MTLFLLIFKTKRSLINEIGLVRIISKVTSNCNQSTINARCKFIPRTGTRASKIIFNLRIPRISMTCQNEPKASKTRQQPIRFGISLKRHSSGGRRGTPTNSGLQIEVALNRWIEITKASLHRAYPLSAQGLGLTCVWFMGRSIPLALPHSLLRLSRTHVIVFLCLSHVVFCCHCLDYFHLGNACGKYKIGKLVRNTLFQTCWYSRTQGAICDRLCWYPLAHLLQVSPVTPSLQGHCPVVWLQVTPDAPIGWQSHAETLKRRFHHPLQELT